MPCVLQLALIQVQAASLWSDVLEMALKAPWEMVDCWVDIGSGAMLNLNGAATKPPVIQVPMRCMPILPAPAVRPRRRNRQCR